MEAAEEENRKKYPSLPSNYVSIAQLQERWIQQQKKKQQKQEEEEKHKHKQKQPEKQHQQGRTMENHRPEKQRMNFCGNRYRNKNGGEGRTKGQRVHAFRPMLDGNSSREIGSEEFSLGAFGVERVDGMEKKMEEKGKEKYYDSKKKKLAGVEGGLIGEDQVQELSEKWGISGYLSGKNGGQEGSSREFEGNRWVEGGLIGEDQVQKLPEKWGISGYLSGKNGGQEGSSGEFEGNGDRNRGVEGNVDLYMVEAETKNRGNEVNLVGMGSKCSCNEGFGEGVWGNSEDGWEIEGGASVCAIEVSRENDELGKEVPVAGNGDDLARGITEEVENVCMVEVLQGNKVEQDVSIGVERKNAEGRFRGKYKKKVSNSRRWRVKVQLGLGKNEETEEGVFIGENEWNGDWKGRIRRGPRGLHSKERISGNMGQNVRRGLRDLSLDDSREGNATARKVLDRGRQEKCGKSRDGGLVWVRKGEASETNAAEI